MEKLIVANITLPLNLPIDVIITEVNGLPVLKANTDKANAILKLIQEKISEVISE